MKKGLAVLLGLVVGTMAVQAVTYQYAYEADALPEASTPVWTKGATSGYDGSISSGVLEINTDTAGSNPRLYYVQDTAWSAATSDVSVVDFRLQIDSVSGDPQAELYAMGMNISDGTRAYGFGFSTNSIEITDGSSSASISIDTTSFRDYRMVLNRVLGTCTLYDLTDGLKIISSGGGAGGNNRILMGAYGGAYGGVAQVDYVRWTNADPLEDEYAYEADAIPEASTPVWAETSSDTNTYDGTVSSGVLTIDTDHFGNSPQLYYIQNAGWLAGLSDISTVDFRLQVDSVSGNPQAEIYAMGMYVSDGARGYQFGFSTNFVGVADASSDATNNIDTTSFRDYRMVLNRFSGTCTLYDLTGGTNTLLISYGESTSVDQLRMGAYSSVFGGVAQVDYVRWNTSETTQETVVLEQSENHNHGNYEGGCWKLSDVGFTNSADPIATQTLALQSVSFMRHKEGTGGTAGSLYLKVFEGNAGGWGTFVGVSETRLDFGALQDNELGTWYFDDLLLDKDTVYSYVAGTNNTSSNPSALLRMGTSHDNDILSSGHLLLGDTAPGGAEPVYSDPYVKIHALPASTEAATIVSGSLSNNVWRMVVDAPGPAALYHPEASADLTTGAGGWSWVQHSDSAGGTYYTTNLDYSASEGSNKVIYVQSTDAERFFKIEGVE